MRIARSSEVLLAALAIGASVLAGARPCHAQSAPPSGPEVRTAEAQRDGLPVQAPPSGTPGAVSPPAVPRVDPAPEPLGQRIAIAGVGLFGVVYLISVVAAGTLLIADSKGNRGNEMLFIPVGGPFATVSSAHAQGGGAVLLVIDGVAQSGGLVMLVVGALMPPPRPGKSALRATPLLAPEVSFGAGSGAMLWRF